MKKIVYVFMSTIFVLTLSVSTFGAEGKIVNGKTMVPVRGVFEELGFTVQWDNTTATATISDGIYEVKVPKGKTYFSVNGQSIKPDVPQQVINGGLYLPLKAIADSVGAITSWNGENKMAHISYNGKDSYVMCGKSYASTPLPSPASVPKSTANNISPIDGVRASFYNDVLNCVRSIVSGVDYTAPDSIPSVDVIKQKIDTFKLQAQNDQEEIFVLSCGLIITSYLSSNIALCEAYYYGIDLWGYYSFITSDEMDSLNEISNGLDLILEEFYNYSGSAIGFSDHAKEFDDTAKSLRESFSFF